MRFGKCLLAVLLGILIASVPVKGQSFAYVVNEFDNNISAYTINAANGALTPVPGSPFPAGTLPLGIVVDPSGRFVYVANYASPFVCTIGTISAYTVNATTGALAPVAGSPFPAGTAPAMPTIDPSGRFLYVPNHCSDDVSAYAINASTGALTPIAGSPFPAGSRPFGATVDPSGHFLYVTNATSANVSAYSINPATGALTQVTGSPFPAGAYAASVTVDPSGRFAYVANSGSANVSAYSINTTTGALTPLSGSPFAAGGAAGSVAVDPSGRFAYVTSGYTNSVWAYAINSTTGILTPVGGSPFPAGGYPYFVTVDRSKPFVYVANYYSGNVSAFTMDATGALTPVSGSPFTAGSYPSSIAIASPVIPGPQYQVCLLYDPTKAAKSGSTIPIKLQLCDSSGANLSSPNLALHATSISFVSTNITGPVEDSGNANPDNDFRYDATLGGTGGYIFNLSTKGLTTGAYNLNFQVSGSTSAYAAPFQVK